MSHFTVLVIGGRQGKQLAPFQENNMGDCPPEYLKFFSVEEECRKDYEEEECCEKNIARDHIILSDDDFSRLQKSDLSSLVMNISLNNPINPGKYDLHAARTSIGDEFIYLKVHEMIGSSLASMSREDEPKQIKLKDKMSFIEYMENDCGYEYNDKEESFGYYENPNAKWDGYELGGRWRGFFKLKNELDKETLANLAKTSSLTLQEIESNLKTDSAQIKHIDFNGMKTEAADQARSHYQKFLKFMGGSIPKMILTWKEAVEKHNIDGKFDRDAAQEEYNGQLAKKEFRAKQDAIESRDSEFAEFQHFVSLEDYQISEEQYVKNAVDKSVSTFAVIKDGKWYEKGNMGWFASVSNAKEQGEWNEEFTKLLETLDEEEWLSVFDCHI
jgi:hypothetical protein